MQTAVRKRAADFCFFGAIPPPRNFAKIRTRGGRGLLPVQPKDSIPPWGHTGARRARRGRFAPESSGRRRTGGGVPRRARRRRFSPGRRGQGAVPGGAAGASGARGAGAFLPGGGGKPGAGGIGRVRRTKAAWRARQRGAGTWPGGAARAVCGAFRGGRGEGAAGGGRGAARPGRRARGGKAGAAARCQDAAGGGAGKTAAPSAACVGFQATSAIEGAGGRKSPFLPYKEALFSGRGSCQIRAVLRPNPCRFGRVAFSAAQSDECVTPGGAGEKPRRKTKRPSERSTPHEKPDFRYRD